MEHKLKHTGSQIDEAIDKVFGINSSAEEINEAIRRIGDKVDKEEGKGLIPDEELAKLEAVKRADWGDNNPFSWAYIKNRTHSFLPWSEETTIDISEETLGSLISPVSQFFSVNGIAHSSEEANGQEFDVQDSTGYDRFDVVFQGENAYLRHTWHGGTDRTISVYSSGNVTPLTSAYIPDAIARKKDVDKKQDALTLAVKDNGNIVIGNIEGQTKEFMPATPSGDPMHYYYLSHFGVTYNAATGFFELEYLKNLTANDMRNAVRVSGDWRHMFNNASSINSMVDKSTRPRTNIAMMSGQITAEKYRYPQWQGELEQFIIGKCNEFNTATMIKIWNVSDGCIFSLAGLNKLRFIVGAIDISTLRENTLSNILRDSTVALEEVRLTKLSTSQSILYQPNLSKQSVQYLLEKRDNKAEISLGLPAVIYNKIMSDGGEWADLRPLCEATGDKGAVILEQNA